MTQDPTPDARPRFRLVSAGRTDVGRERDHNEDRLLMKPAIDLFIVADGMGGHNAGEVASALAALSLENCLMAAQNAPLPAELMDDPREMTPEARNLVAGARKANGDVFEISKSHPEHSGMGTTLVAAHISSTSGQLHVAHVGDSRCYRLRGGKLEQLTRDHSLIGDAIAYKPDITEAELALFPKNVISRALGRAATVEIDIRTDPVEAGDVYVLCSDGLCGMITDAAILEHLKSEPDPERACKRLVDAANDAGGQDNVTVIVVRVDPL